MTHIIWSHFKVVIHFIRKPVQVVTCFSFIIFVYVRRKMIKDIASIEIVDLRPRSMNETGLMQTFLACKL